MSRGLRYWQPEPRSGERKFSLAPILSPLAGLLVMAHFSPRLTPWAILFRHTVAEGLRTHCQNLACAPPELRPFGGGGVPGSALNCAASRRITKYWRDLLHLFGTNVYRNGLRCRIQNQNRHRIVPDPATRLS